VPKCIVVKEWYNGSFL